MLKGKNAQEAFNVINTDDTFSGKKYKGRLKLYGDPNYILSDVFRPRTSIKINTTEALTSQNVNDTDITVISTALENTEYIWKDGKLVTNHVVDNQITKSGSATIESQE